MQKCCSINFPFLLTRCLTFKKPMWHLINKKTFGECGCPFPVQPCFTVSWLNTFTHESSTQQQQPPSFTARHWAASLEHLGAELFAQVHLSGSSWGRDRDRERERAGVLDQLILLYNKRLSLSSHELGSDSTLLPLGLLPCIPFFP